MKLNKQQEEALRRVLVSFLANFDTTIPPQMIAMLLLAIKNVVQEEGGGT